jgi:Holliday junction resolvase RusA-like endonuclease
MTAPLTITLPCPPSANHLFRNVRGKGRVKTTRYLTWFRAAGNEVLAQRRHHVAGPVMVDITCKRQRATSDIDNRIKACLDLLVEMGLIDDDRHVQEIRARWGDVAGAVVTIIQLPGTMRAGKAA